MLSTMLNPLSVAFGTNAVSIAWLISSYTFAYAIAALLLGYLSDRIDGSRLLLMALLSFAIDGVGIANIGQRRAHRQRSRRGLAHRCNLLASRRGERAEQVCPANPHMRARQCLFQS